MTSAKYLIESYLTEDSWVLSLSDSDLEILTSFLDDKGYKRGLDYSLKLSSKSVTLKMMTTRILRDKSLSNFVRSLS